MGTYSIKELEKIAGIKAHTIRIWEQRYDLLNPERTDTNIRVYSDEDLKRLLNVSLLQKAGHKISKIAKYDESELNEAIAKASNTELKTEAKIQELVIGMADFDELKINTILEKSIENIGLDQTIKEVIYPFLNRIGVMWLTGYINPAQEHFSSCLIRQKIITAIDKIPFQPSINQSVILFLPENETHEMAMLYTNYLLKSKGYNTVYLGQSVPFESLIEAYETIKPEMMVCSMTIFQPVVNLQGYIYMLGKKFKDSKVYISGRQVLEEEKNLELLDNMRMLKSHQEFVEELGL